MYDKNGLKLVLIEQGLTENEAKFLANTYGDLGVNVEDIDIYDNAEKYMRECVLGDDVLKSDDSLTPDEFVTRMNEQFSNLSATLLPSGRVAEVLWFLQ